MKPIAESGLAARLILLGVLSALLITTGGGLLLRQQLHAVLLRSFEQGLAERADRIAADLQSASADRAALDGPASSGEFGRIFSGWYWQLQWGDRERGAVRSRSLWDSSTDLAAAVREGATLARTTGPRGEALMGLQRPLTLDGQPAALHLYGPAAQTDAEIERIDRVLIALQSAFIAVLALLTVAQARIGLAPMRRLQAALAAVRGGRRQRVGGRFGPDLDPLADEINHVLARNAQIVERARHHAANLSHALKKPLALLGAESHAEVVDSRLVRAQVQSMSNLIDRHLARSASGAGASRWIGVEPALDALVALMRRLHADKGLHWELHAEPGLRWKGEPTDLEEMLGNLLDNAGKWAATRVRLQARRAGPGIELQVDDDGDGLRAEDMARATQRGQRFDEAVEGSGLGLAIADDIAGTYGGRLTLDASPLGGLRCTLTLA